MRTLALDIGEVRVGLAVSDSAGKIATPLKVLPADAVLNHGAEFRRIVEDWEIEQLVSGLPMTMAGEEGPQAASICSWAASAPTDTSRSTNLFRR